MLVVGYLKICDGNVHLKAIFIKITHFTNHKALVINDMCQWRIQGGAPPPTAQNFLDFIQFLGKFDKIICWCPPPEGRRPLLQGILYPRLSVRIKYVCKRCQILLDLNCQQIPGGNLAMRNGDCTDRCWHRWEAGGHSCPSLKIQASPHFRCNSLYLLLWR